jgi:hypothetical protein
MSRNGKGHGKTTSGNPTPPDLGAHPTGADDPAYMMPLGELAFSCMNRTSHTLTLAQYLAKAFHDDDDQIDHLFKGLGTLLQPIVSDLCVLEERLSNLSDEEGKGKGADHDRAS